MFARNGMLRGLYTVTGPCGLRPDPYVQQLALGKGWVVGHELCSMICAYFPVMDMNFVEDLERQCIDRENQNLEM